jgi:hypothetical protein
LGAVELDFVRAEPDSDRIMLCVDSELCITLDDVNHEILRFGLDVFPPLELSKEQVRAQNFYQTARDNWPHLFNRLTLSNTEFTITQQFNVDTNRADVVTFVFNPRGPVVAFPRKLGGSMVLDRSDEDFVSEFGEILSAIHRSFPKREVLRVGVVREIVFHTGETPAGNVLVPVQQEFGGAAFAGGESLFVFQDDFCNVRVTIAPVELRKRTVVAASKKVVEAHEAFGLRVALDVNNREMRPLDGIEIDQVIERARGLWPEPLITYLNRRAKCSKQ